MNGLDKRQSCSIHVWEKDGQLNLFVNFDPPVEPGPHVPTGVEHVVNCMVASALDAHPELAL